MFFMMHDDTLYMCSKNLLRTVSKNASFLTYCSDDCIFFMSTKMLEVNGRTVRHSSIFMIECLFGSFKNTMVYEDVNMRAEILNFGVDNVRNRIMILTGIKNNHDKRDKFLTIYDIE